MGLVSNGGVHSSLNHLLSLCSFLKENFSGNVFIHGFSDGRDCSPRSGIEAFKKLNEHIKDSNIVLSSIIGRYFAMDRDQRWNRIKKAYDLLIEGKGKLKKDYKTAFEESNSNNITDEYCTGRTLLGVVAMELLIKMTLLYALTLEQIEEDKSPQLYLKKISRIMG